MTLLERVRAAQKTCTRCGRREPFERLLVCADCAEHIVAPTWRKNLRARDETAA